MALVVSVGGASRAKADTWTGGGTDNNWTTAANWGGVAPVASDSLAFAGTNRLAPVNNFSAGFQFTNITFSAGAGAFSLTGNRVLLAGNVTNSSTSLQTLGLDLTLNAGSHTFTGGTGALSLASTLDMNSNDTTVSALNQTVFGLITDNSASIGTTTLNITGAASTTFAGSIADGFSGRSVAVFNTGNSIAALTGFNSYSGGTIIDTGTIQINSNTGLGSTGGFTTINNGTLEILANSGDINEGFRSYQLGSATSTIQVDSGATYTINGSVSDWTGPGSLTVSGAGSLTLSGINTYTGSTNVNGGTLILDSTIAGTTAVTLNNGGTLIFSDPSSANNFGAGTTITVGSGGGTLRYGSTAATTGLSSTNKVVITAGGTLTIDDNDSATTKITFVNNATFSGAGNLLLQNIGTWPEDTYQMGGNNSAFTGNITVAAPGGVGMRLQPTSGSVNSLGTGTITIANGSEIFFSSAGITYANNFNIAGIGTIVDNPPLGVIRMVNGQTLTGTINLTGDATITVGTTATNSGILTGRITGTGNALTLASGTFTLNSSSGSADNYGPTTPGSAATIVGIVNTRPATVILGNVRSLSPGGVQMQGGTLDLNGLNIAIANLSSSSANGTVSGGNAGIAPFTTAPATTAILSFGDSSSLTYGGTLIDGNGKLAIIKTGAGTATLSGTNTYSGATTVSTGELDISPTGSITSTAITVASGATLSILSGGKISTATALVANGTVNFNTPSATIISALNGTGGTVTLNATNLVINTGGSFAGTILDNNTAGTLTVNGTLATNGIQLGTLTLNANQQILTNGTPAGTSKINALNLLGSSSAWTTGLDLTNNKLIVEDPVTKSTTLARLQNQAQFGAAHSAGIFTTAALPSTMAIAVVDNAALPIPLSTFGGLPVDANSILVGAELLGDANIDGHVDLTDLSTILNNFGTSTSAWTSGNFDGASTVDLTDLSDVLNNFGLTNPNPFTSSATVTASPIPEPASLLIIAASTLAISAFKRHRKP